MTDAELLANRSHPQPHSYLGAHASGDRVVTARNGRQSGVCSRALLLPWFGLAASLRPAAWAASSAPCAVREAAITLRCSAPVAPPNASSSRPPGDTDRGTAAACRLQGD